VLASGSPYRRELLARLRLTARAVSPDVDETPRAGEPLIDYVRRLAHEKARAALAWVTAEELTGAGPSPRRLYIGSDQAAMLDGERLGKPGTFEVACRQLARASGRSVEFLTGVAVLDPARERSVVDAVAIRVNFRPLAAAEIERYVRAETPYDCAGGFKSEGLGIALFRSIDGPDPTALIGLPLIRLGEMLRSFGLPVP